MVAAGFKRQNKRQGIKVLEHNYFHIIVLPRHKIRQKQVGEQTALAHELKEVNSYSVKSMKHGNSAKWRPLTIFQFTVVLNLLLKLPFLP